MVKTLKNLWNQKADDLESWYICSSDDPGLTLTYFIARSNLVPYAFIWEKGKTKDFSESPTLMHTKDVCRITNNVDVDRTAPGRAV